MKATAPADQAADDALPSRRQCREKELLRLLRHNPRTLAEQYREAIGMSPEELLPAGKPAALMILAILDHEFPQVQL